MVPSARSCVTIQYSLDLHEMIIQVVVNGRHQHLRCWTKMPERVIGGEAERERQIITLYNGKRMSIMGSDIRYRIRLNA
jgi:hypothetical protein